MKKLSIFLSAIFSAFIWISFATPSISNPSYTINWNDVKIYRTDNSNWWYLDINLQNPETSDWLHFGEVKISDQEFTYTKQWEWDQNIRIIPWDWGDEVRFTVSDGTSTNITSSNVTTSNDEVHGAAQESISNDTTQDNTQKTANRTVIPVVPKTGPSGSLIWIILATLAIFGGYIYIKKKADI